LGEWLEPGVVDRHEYGRCFPSDQQLRKAKPKIRSASQNRFHKAYYLVAVTRFLNRRKDGVPKALLKNFLPWLQVDITLLHPLCKPAFEEHFGQGKKQPFGIMQLLARLTPDNRCSRICKVRQMVKNPVQQLHIGCQSWDVG
jgi:hypothetical protein